MAILDAENQIFHLRNAAAEDNSYLLYIVEGGNEREIARIEADDPNFSSRVLVGIGDAGGACSPRRGQD